MLKAYFWFKLKKEPPFSHNLLLLLKLTDLLDKLSDEQKEIITILMPLNIEARYPSDKQLLFKELTEVKVAQILTNTKKLAKWIKNLIKY